MFLARSQKSFGELEFAKLLHFLWIKDFLVSRRTHLARFLDEIYIVHDYQELEGSGTS